MTLQLTLRYFSALKTFLSDLCWVCHQEPALHAGWYHRVWAVWHQAGRVGQSFHVLQIVGHLKAPRIETLALKTNFGSCDFSKWKFVLLCFITSGHFEVNNLEWVPSWHFAIFSPWLTWLPPWANVIIVEQIIYCAHLQTWRRILALAQKWCVHK